jgi:histidine triad (HIT) family protein
MSNCVFCTRIENGEYDARNGWAVTFEPLNPVTAGHRLVVSACHARSVLSDPTVSGATMEFAVTVARRFGIEQCNFITSAGPAATQTIEHLHIHIVPRREGDGLALPWTGQQKIGGKR